MKLGWELFSILLTSHIWFTYNEHTTFKIEIQENWISTCKNKKLDFYPLLSTKINSKWIKDLNIKAKTIKFVEENREKLHEIKFDNDFLDSKSRGNNRKKMSWKLKCRTFVNQNSLSTEKKQRIFANHVSDKELISRTYKEPMQLNNKKTPNNPIKK